jgi:hypothetical protein
VLAKEGVAVPMTDLFGVGGQRLLDEVELAKAYRIRVESLRDLIELCDREIAMLEKGGCPVLRRRPRLPRRPDHPRGGPGSGRGLRGRDRRHLEVHLRAALVQLGRPHPHPPRVRREGPSWTHHQAGLSTRALGRRRGGVPPTRRHTHPGSPPTGGERRGKQIGRVAAARKLLILVYYGLCDGEVRCLAKAG